MATDQAGSAERVSVRVASGVLSGVVEGGLKVFRGVPYAAAPVGALRFAPPAPAPAWSGERDASQFGPWSPQNIPANPLTSGIIEGEQDEDCLNLNIWTPAVGDGTARPVLVWIHGGGFTGGSGASGLYKGAALARRGDVVVVTINYRLGALGFLVAGGRGNWGLLDQVAALAWVRSNIEAFGGDPTNVTIFGESAGSMSVADLLAMPAADGLFAKAIAQSGPPNATPISVAETTAGKFLAEVGVSSVDELRSVPVDRILAAQAVVAAGAGAAGLAFTPVVDGVSIPEPPQRALAEGAAARVPLIIGTNRDEAKMFMVADPKGRDPDEATMRRRIERAFAAGAGSDGGRLEPDQAIDGYRRIREARGADVSPREIWSAIETDRMFRAGSIRAAEAHAAHQAATYMYLFTWESPAMRGALGACHALEIPFVFGNLDGPQMDRFAGAGPEAERLSAEMMDSWLAFARSGTPAGPGGAEWPPYDSTRRATMIFGPDTHVEDAPLDEERHLWEGAPRGAG